MAETKVMLVDDAALMRLAVANLIKSDSSFRIVATAENGEQAIQRLREAQPDIIIVDIEMPVMDGLTFIRNVRLRTRAKIVVLSSVAASGSPKAVQARALGADAVLQKPSGSVSTDIANKGGAVLLETLRRLAA